MKLKHARWREGISVIKQRGVYKSHKGKYYPIKGVSHKEAVIEVTIFFE